MPVRMWGLLGPDQLESHRRVRTLEVATAVRRFNDLAVPGMGGVWFGKQLLLAALGVAVAEEVNALGRKVPKIGTANAVEALACWLAHESNDWQADLRLRGITKFRNRDKSESTFERLRRPGAYVTQPMRQATVQPLLALQLVESSSERFSTYSTTEFTRRWIDKAFSEFSPWNGTVLSALKGWAMGKPATVIKSKTIRQALSPLEPMAANARGMLRDRLSAGGEEAIRRRNALEWVGTLNKSQGSAEWNERPPLIDPFHWNDLRAGSLFFGVRDAALDALNLVELRLSRLARPILSLEQPIPEELLPALVTLKERAEAFLQFAVDPTQDVATDFCRDCVEPPASVIRNLVERDGRVLQLRGAAVTPGSAFLAHGVEDAGESSQTPAGTGDAPGEEVPGLPAGISKRVINLYYLHWDLEGKLNQVLSGTTDDGKEPK